MAFIFTFPAEDLAMGQATEGNKISYYCFVFMPFGFRRRQPSPTLTHGLLLSNCSNIFTCLVYFIVYIVYMLRRSINGRNLTVYPPLSRVRHRHRTAQDDHNSSPLPYLVCIFSVSIHLSAAGDTNRIFVRLRPTLLVAINKQTHPKSPFRLWICTK